MPYSKKGGQSETLLNTCIAHSNRPYLFLINNASDWLSEDVDLWAESYMQRGWITAGL